MPGLAFMSRTATVAGSPFFFALLSAVLLALLPGIGVAAGSTEHLDLTGHWSGYFGLVVFVIAYLLVMSEELPTCVSPNRSSSRPA